MKFTKLVALIFGGVTCATPVQAENVNYFLTVSLQNSDHTSEQAQSNCSADVVFYNTEQGTSVAVSHVTYRGSSDHPSPDIETVHQYECYVTGELASEEN